MFQSGDALLACSRGAVGDDCLQRMSRLTGVRCEVVEACRLTFISWDFCSSSIESKGNESRKP